MKNFTRSFLFATSSFFAFNLFADTADLDDIKLYDIVKVEQCLDQAYDKIAGHARKLEFKVEGDDPVYEFDIESVKDGYEQPEAVAEENVSQETKADF